MKPYYADESVTLFMGEERYCEIAAKRLSQDVLPFGDLA